MGFLCKYVYASPSEENVQEWDTVTKPGTLTLVQGHLAYLLLPQQSPLVLRPNAPPPTYTHTQAHRQIDDIGVKKMKYVLK